MGKTRDAVESTVRDATGWDAIYVVAQDVDELRDRLDAQEVTIGEVRSVAKQAASLGNITETLRAEGAKDFFQQCDDDREAFEKLGGGVMELRDRLDALAPDAEPLGDVG